MLLTLLLSASALAALSNEPPPPDVQPAETIHSRLAGHLAGIPAKRAALGDTQHREGLVQTEVWLVDQLKSLGITPQTQEFVWASPALKALLAPKDAPPADAAPSVAQNGDRSKDEHQYTFRNYIVEFPGTDLASDVLILAAHYDAVPNSPGADDNASGVAALLEVARTLRIQKHRRTIRLVFFTLEEVGLIGSMEYVKAHAANWKSTPAPEGSATDAKPTPAKERVIGMVSLDGIGYFSDDKGSQTSPVPKIGGKPVLGLDVPDVGNFLGIGGILKHRKFSQAFIAAMTAAVPDLPIVAADSLPFAPPDFLRSDHAPFLAAGQPAIILTDTANFRNPHYHKPTDTPDTIDLARLAKAATALAAAASALAETVK